MGLLTPSNALPGSDVPELAAVLESFLAEHPRAAVLEDGRVLFDMPRAQYAIATQHGRCVLQVWSEERNLVRTVTGVQVRKDSLRLEVRRFGQSKPQQLHVLADRDTRTPTTRTVARSRYLKLLEHVLPRRFGDWKLDGLRSAADLEHSFGPAYARGMLARGQSAWALIGVNEEETYSTLDGILTLGLLWLDYCRERAGSRRVVEGLKVIVPAGAAELTQSRMGWLNPALAKYELYELDRGSEELTPIEVGRNGNLEMKLLQAFEPAATLERLKVPIERVLGLVPPGARSRVDVRARSAGEVAISLHGLEFARVRHALAPGSFTREDRITFGAGSNETQLADETAAGLRELVARLFASRHAHGSAADPLYRLQPERWMESVMRARLEVLDPQLQSECVYSQVPAFAAGDRGMLDLLSITRAGRLAVLELKADDDLHLPLQGLDYWIRVHRLHQERASATTKRESARPGVWASAFERAGYFPGRDISPEPPLLYYVAPALRVHPATTTLLRYLSPEVEWTLIAVNEDWRREPSVVWRKRAGENQETRNVHLGNVSDSDHPVAEVMPRSARLPSPAVLRDQANRTGAAQRSARLHPGLPGQSGLRR